jgi:hypothetical protein
VGNTTPGRRFGELRMNCQNRIVTDEAIMYVHSTVGIIQPN